MAGVRVCVWVILWVAAAIHGDGVTVSAPAPTPDCSSAFLELTDCLTFVENGSTVAKPAGKCCSGLKKVVKKEVSCLCDVFKQGASFGVNITKALTLPSACGVSTPPISKCNMPSPSPGAPSSVATGAPSPVPGKSTAVSLPGPCFRGLLGSMAVTLWLHHQFQGLEEL
ncbi:hypothetical protein BHE74_00034908 [Ensete ventricosum]|uniref:Uncharacterized protein n=1 Tax=Ensete ventricosum TaxID=4639 RepID=A0A426Z195_ENSVE|nr:hypothetical protein B296_00021155 [Ensete ventricosum]RWW21083.1 hypothetical protein GW17_00014769 [Ensete ventricosum]RWW58249.1 hypothetical protein BHE74_00034908 [Ensete ventricosum]RZS03496.1 hypothetical protein BHM03_00033678 [Ensete ventricosum]